MCKDEGIVMRNKYSIDTHVGAVFVSSVESIRRIRRSIGFEAVRKGDCEHHVAMQRSIKTENAHFITIAEIKLVSLILLSFCVRLYIFEICSSLFVDIYPYTRAITACRRTLSILMSFALSPLS